MITCPQCGAQNLPGMAYCENCGSPLPQQTAQATEPPQAYQAPQAQQASQVPQAPQAASEAPPVIVPGPAQAPSAVPQDPLAAAMPQPVMPVDQPPPAPDLAAPSPAVSGANAVAADAAAPVPEAAPAPTVAAPVEAAPAQPATLSIVFPSGQTFTMQGDEINVGRADVAQNWHPELDVIPYGGGAPDLGVSRHQARLVRQNGGFAVIDMGSTNGTYINGRATPYNQPTPLHDGDTLSFGALNTQVSIQ